MEHSIKFAHYRTTAGDPSIKPRRLDGTFIPGPTGGFTVCSIYDKDSKKLLATDVACCSSSDNYNKKLGRYISYGRALKDLQENGPISNPAPIQDVEYV